MKHIEEVGKALDKAFESVTGYRNTDTVREATAAFSALEADVRELVEAAKLAREYVVKMECVIPHDALGRNIVSSDLDKITAALSKFTGAECPKGGYHKWGTDGLHSNEFCKKCFANKPEAK